MKLLICGDVVGRSGLESVTERIPRLRRDMHLDAVIVNAENAAGGFGTRSKDASALIDVGVDVITGGNHSWKHPDYVSSFNSNARYLVPHNLPRAAPGRGVCDYTLPDGRKILVVNLLGQAFMPQPANDPFSCMDEILASRRLGGGEYHAIIVDIHAESTGEKMTLAHYLDGRVSAVVGTHTHVPTADAMILGKGTAYQTDLGMCGDYNGILGFEPAGPIRVNLTKLRGGGPFKPMNGEGTLCGLYVELDDQTGHAKIVRSLKLGGKLGDTEAT